MNKFYHLIYPSHLDYLYKHYKDLDEVRRFNSNHTREVAIHFLHHKEDPEWFESEFTFDKLFKFINLNHVYNHFQS